MTRTIRTLTLLLIVAALTMCFAFSASAATYESTDDALEYLDGYSDHVQSDPGFEENIAAAIETLKKNGLWIYTAEAGGTDLRETDMGGAVAIVLGSEGDGVSELVRKKSDFVVSIPMYGKVNSFNVSTAAAVLLCEAAYQQRKGKK